MTGNKILATHHTIELSIEPLTQGSPLALVEHISIMDFFKKILVWNYLDKKRMFGNNKFCGLIPIVQIDEHNNNIYLLLTLSDKDEDNQIARDFNTGLTRELLRSENEGADKRVHVVIKINPNDKYNAKFAIEHKTGVTTKLLIDTLNYFVRDARASTDATINQYFIGKHPTERYLIGDKAGQAKPLDFKIKFGQTSEISEEIVNALASGRFNNIEFYQSIPNPQTFDPTGTFSPKRNKVELTVTGQIFRPNSTTLREKMADFRFNFEQLFHTHPDLKGTRFTIRFTDANGNEQIAYYESEIEELVWAKKRFIDGSLKQPVTATPSLNVDLCDRMLAGIN